MVHGKTAVTLADIQQVVDQIVERFHPYKVWLFGSFADGYVKPAVSRYLRSLEHDLSLQILEKGMGTRRQTSPPPATTTDPLCLCWMVLLALGCATLHVSETDSHDRTRQASGLSHCCDASPPDGHRFASGPAAPHFFIPHKTQGLVCVS